MASILHFFIQAAALVVYPLISFMVSLVLTSLCIRLLPRLGYVDKPGGRHIHEHCIPRGGGIAVAISFFLALLAFTLGNRSMPGAWNLLKRLVLPSLIIIVLGLLDDRIELRSLPKLLIHCFVGILVWYDFGGENMVFYQWPLPVWLSLPLMVFWVVLVINAFNLIDGLDGLASGIASISSLCLAVWFLLGHGICAEAVGMLCLCGACLGFLRYNFHPAKIFLGDTGSTFLGLIFAISGIGTMDRAVTFTSLLLPMLVIGLPIFDVMLAVWRRSVRKLLNPNASGIMEGDQDHLHHRLLRETHAQSRTALTMYLISLIFSMLVIALVLLRNTAPAVGYLLLLLAALIMLRRLSVIEMFDSVTLMRKNFSVPRKGLLLAVFHPFIDLCILTFSGAAALLLLGHYSFALLCWYVAPCMLFFFLSDSYRVYWLRAGLRARWQLLTRALLGTILATILQYLYLRYVTPPAAVISLKHYFSCSLLFILLSCGLLTLERFLIHYAEGFWLRDFSLKCSHKKLIPTVLFGGGRFCRLFIRGISCAGFEQYPYQIIGIIDDDSVLHGLQVYDHKVLGGSDDLPELLKRYHFKKLIVTSSNIKPEKLTELQRFCAENHIGFSCFTFGEQEL